MGDRRIALVTGASKGIGAAIAAGLAKDGFDIWINYQKDHDAAEKVKKIEIFDLKILNFVDLPKLSEHFTSYNLDNKGKAGMEKPKNLGGVISHFYLDQFNQTKSLLKLLEQITKQMKNMPKDISKWQIPFIATYQEDPLSPEKEPFFMPIALGIYERGEQEGRLFAIPFAEKKYVDAWINSLLYISEKPIRLFPMYASEDFDINIGGFHFDVDKLAYHPYSDPITDMEIESHPYLSGNVTVKIERNIWVENENKSLDGSDEKSSSPVTGNENKQGKDLLSEAKPIVKDILASENRPSSLAQKVVDRGDLRENQKVLSLGSGNGFDEAFFAQNGIEVIATDNNPKMIEALKNVDQQVKTNLYPLLSDMQKV